MRAPAAPRRPLNPFLLRTVLASGINQDMLRRAAGWPNYPSYFVDLRTPSILATPVRVARLVKLAETLSRAGVDFRADEIFLDEPAAPRPVKRAAVALAEAR